MASSCAASSATISADTFTAGVDFCCTVVVVVVVVVVVTPASPPSFVGDAVVSALFAFSVVVGSARGGKVAAEALHSSVQCEQQPLQLQSPGYSSHSQSQQLSLTVPSKLTATVAGHVASVPAFCAVVVSVGRGGVSVEPVLVDVAAVVVSQFRVVCVTCIVVVVDVGAVVAVVTVLVDESFVVVAALTHLTKSDWGHGGDSCLHSAEPLPHRVLPSSQT